jgi:hypothetical protein
MVVPPSLLPILMLYSRHAGVNGLALSQVAEKDEDSASFGRGSESALQVHIHLRSGI